MRRGLGRAGLAALLLSLAAFEKPPGPDSVLQTTPCKVQVEDSDGYFPQYAQEHRVEGSAVIECRITADGGGVENCVAVEESPPNYCFGVAAVRMAQDFKMKPGAAPGAMFRTRVRFDLPDPKWHRKLH
jgi:TonB family protein